MDWLGRSRRPAPETAPPVEASTPAAEGAAPGIAALLQGVHADRTHAVLDLGAAADASLRMYSRFARWVRFADLLGDDGWGPSGAAGGMLRAAVPDGERRFDLVFGWDVLDRVFPDERARLIGWLTEITTPRARLHIVVRGSTDAFPYPLRFTLLDDARIRWERAGSAPLAPSRLLPAEVATLLRPFNVMHAFTLRSGLREYVTARTG